LETKINAGQEELRQEINAFQEMIKNIEADQAEFEERVTHTLREDLSRSIEAGQTEFEEKVTCAVDARLKNVLSMVEVTRQDVEATRRDLEARTRRVGGSSAGNNADKIKPPKFYGSTSWVVFQSQFDARPSITIGPPQRRPLTS
jgi:polyhydroxyalkanoate synthesis regulator phasin